MQSRRRSQPEDALENIDRAIHKQSAANGVTVDSAAWRTIKSCDDAQEALSCLDQLAGHQVASQRSTQALLSQLDYRLDQLDACPREFARRLHAVVVFDTSVGLRDLKPGTSCVRSLTVRGIKQGDIPLSMVAMSTSPETALSFDPIEVIGDNFVRFRVSVLDGRAVPRTMVAVRIVAAVASTSGKTEERSMIVIDPGHGGIDPGCAGNGLVEKELTLRAAKLLRDLAQVVGLPLQLTRDADITMPLSMRGQLARRVGASQVVSLHFDANADPRVGRLTCYCSAEDSQSTKLAQAVIRAALQALTTGSRVVHVEPTGWKRRAHNVVHAFERPALLIECAFLSNIGHSKNLRQPFGLGSLSIAILFALSGAVTSKEKTS